jgi:hypothetical protein
MQARKGQTKPPEPLRLPEPLSQLPWDVAQDEFGVQGADFIGVMGALILKTAKDQFRAYPVDFKAVTGPLPLEARKDEMRPGAD